jgi:hypothetical protein
LNYSVIYGGGIISAVAEYHYGKVKNSMPQAEPIDPGKYNFPTLMNDIENGRVRLPPFQREFIWTPTKVMDLMDSIYKGFPIGSLFYWKADRRYVTLFRDIKSLSLPSPAPDQELFFILDGQQRLTSIWATFKGSIINGEEYARICLDLDAATKYEDANPEARREIRVFKETEADNVTLVSLHDILSDSVATYDAIRDPLPPEKRQTLTKARERFRNYPFSVVKVFNLELEDAVEVFQRINQGGKRLTRFELVAANCWSETFDLVKSVREFNERVKQRTDFGMVEPITFVQAISLVKFGQCETEHELRLRSKDVEELWPRISKAIGDAIDWMRDNYGVIRGDMIPYYAMLAVLACYFSEHGTTNVPLEHKLWIDRWFWRSAFSERYSQAQSSQMANDAKTIRELINGTLELPKFPLTVSKDSILKMKINRSSGAARNGVLCLLAHMGPEHLVTGADVSLAKDHFSDIKDPNAHHIFPKNFLKKTLKRPVEEVHLMPNFCFLPADLNNKIKDRAPSDYFAEFRGLDGTNRHFDAALASHLIPSAPDSPIWNDDYDAFLRQRTDLIWGEILKAVGEGDIYNSGAAVPRDEARLAVDEIEVKLRRTIQETLHSHFGEDYWKRAVPGDVQEKIKERINEQNRAKLVTRIVDPHIRFQYADIMDLYKIIDKNWQLFKDRMESRETLKSHFLALKNYRNPLSHARDIDVVEQKQGEAAVVWFRRAVSASANSTIISDDEQETNVP